MRPELFELPFIHLTVKSYGLMMVIGFMSAVYLIRYLSRKIIPDPQLITNAALYSLIAGVVGARVFYVVHYFDQFRGRPLSVFAIWEGGLELLGGVLLAITVIFIYLRYHKLPIRVYLDILGIALVLALVFGRIGCFMNGCCFGKPTKLLWGVRFPYGSPAYRSQVNANPKRNRPEPQLELPLQFFGYETEDGTWYTDLKPYEYLTPEQKALVETGPYRSLAVHPTQLFSSATAAICCLLLYFFWRRYQPAVATKGKTAKADRAEKFCAKPGCTFALMFILYGLARFFMEFVRDDNPFGLWGLTISQNIGIAMIIFGSILMVLFSMMKPFAASAKKK